MSLAFQSTDEDVGIVLRTLGHPWNDEVNERLLGLIDDGIVEREALRGDELDEQTDLAHAEIMRQLVTEIGVADLRTERKPQ